MINNCCTYWCIASMEGGNYLKTTFLNYIHVQSCRNCFSNIIEHEKWIQPAIFTFCWSLISSVKSSFSDICRRIISQVVCNADFCKQLSNHPKAIILKTLFCYSIKYIQQIHKLLPWSFMIIRQQSCLMNSGQSTCSRHLAVVCLHLYSQAITGI